MDTPFHYDFSLLPHYLEILYAKLRIAVIYAGDKGKDGSVIYQTHNPRAWKSYEIVARDIQSALQEVGFQHVYVMPDNMTLPQNLKKKKIHLAWLNTGGVQGYNPLSHAPAMLEMLGIPYVGHNPLNSSTLDNKHSFKRELQALGISTARFMTWHPSRGLLKPKTNRCFTSAFNGYRGPFVVKPVTGRGSLHIHVIDSAAELPRAAAKVHQVTANNVLIEPYLCGREFCVSVCGYVTSQNGRLSKSTRPFAFSTVERFFEEDEAIFTSMDQKAINGKRARLIGDEEAAVKQQLIELAQTIYWDFNLKSLIRVDVRTDAQGVLHVLEANPKPDLKKPLPNVTSLVSIGLEEHGMSYNDLIFGLLADRLDYLLTHNIRIVPHIVDLLM